MKKKYYFLLALILIFFIKSNVFSQNHLPIYLSGTWKIENKSMYEHWDVLNDQSMKGFSYEWIDGKMKINEYLHISKKQKNIYYKATVLKQNNGKEIVFKQVPSDTSLVFINLKHDFPKKISYKQIDMDTLLVVVSDGKLKQFSYKIHKINTNSNQLVSVNSSINPNYDEILAKKLGADDYGMKSYIFVVLTTGPNTTTDREFISEAFRGHLDNINRLVSEGKLIVAGPFGKNDQKYRGLFILNTDKMEEAHQYLQSDPAVREQLLEANLFPWYGSAALSEYLRFSEMVWKTKP
ncbi:MAG TPA: DUF6265 family protein [Saprospiraceae bacterium]|nr:DUF6265 family protein [Saprospiraceae bacterium]